MNAQLFLAKVAADRAATAFYLRKLRAFNPGCRKTIRDLYLRGMILTGLDVRPRVTRATLLMSLAHAKAGRVPFFPYDGLGLTQDTVATALESVGNP